MKDRLLGGIYVTDFPDLFYRISSLNLLRYRNNQATYFFKPNHEDIRWKHSTREKTLSTTDNTADTV